jgi:hypothetical protein
MWAHSSAAESQSAQGRGSILTYRRLTTSTRLSRTTRRLNPLKAAAQFSPSRLLVYPRLRNTSQSAKSRGFNVTFCAADVCDSPDHVSIRQKVAVRFSHQAFYLTVVLDALFQSVKSRAFDSGETAVRPMAQTCTCFNPLWSRARFSPYDDPIQGFDKT